MKRLFPLCAIGISVCLTCGFSDTPATGVKVTVGKVYRWSGGSSDGKSFGGPVVVLKFSGADLERATGFRVTVKNVTDEAGNPLKKKADVWGDDGKFMPLQKSFGGFGVSEQPKAGEFETSLSFLAPDGTQAIQTLAGTLELELPSRDPASVITASYATDSGKPIVNAALKAAGVEITLQKPSGKPTGSGTLNGVAYQEYGLSYQIKDPQNKVTGVEFFDTQGKKLASSGSGSGSVDGGATRMVSASFLSQPPANVVVKIYLLTGKSILSVPFELKDIALADKQVPKPVEPRTNVKPKPVEPKSAKVSDITILSAEFGAKGQAADVKPRVIELLTKQPGGFVVDQNSLGASLLPGVTKTLKICYVYQGNTNVFSIMGHHKMSYQSLIDQASK